MQVENRRFIKRGRGESLRDNRQPINDTELYVAPDKLVLLTHGPRQATFGESLKSWGVHDLKLKVVDSSRGGGEMGKGRG